MRVLSSDHVNVAVHQWGGRGRPLLFSHATGFHAHCYLPVADRLDDRFATAGLDHRGHGDTPRPDDWAVDWDRYGDDALVAAQAVAPEGGLVAFGHSMGGASLLMAAHRQSSLFDLIVVYEPIVFPTDGVREGDPSEMVESARRRRTSFASFEAAIENYSSKPPLDLLDPDCLRLYVGHGFRPAPEGVRIICDPEHEARTFETGSMHPTWDLLPEIKTRVVVIGSGDSMGAAKVAAAIAERLPDSMFIHQPDANHFQPLIDPAGTAELITDVAL